MKQREVTAEHRGSTMAEDQHTWIMWSAVISAIGGLFGLFLKHIIRHGSEEEVQKLRDTVQYKDNCIEIVKRFDENQRNMNKKLDTLLDYHMKE